jgi:hypothetical protein
MHSEKLAQRAAKAGPYRLLEGMLIYTPKKVRRYHRKWLRVGKQTLDRDDLGEFVPRVDDPATVGCLLYLLRESHGDTGITTALDHDGWSVMKRGHAIAAGSYSEAEAIVAALEMGRR